MSSVDLIKEFGSNFINYSMAVNTDRAIPDAKSGLKPVARRILYESYRGGRASSKPHVKCAQIVGDVMSHLHPHGDSSIYGALVRLAQDWVMRYPLIDFHGNIGNIDGDGPAAYRYTEARLAKISEDGLLQGLKKRNVDFMPNYDDSSEEPITLPAIFPNLLCNPNSGIGVALACNWLPHNLNDVAGAIFAYMDGKDVPIIYPDFPTGGLIINKDAMPSIMKSGRGSIKIRARYKVEKNNLVFYEIPYGTNTESIIDEIGKASEDDLVKGIANIRNESTTKVRIVIECAKGYSPDSIAQKLYLKTKLQTSISYNQVALVDRVPTELTFEDAIKIYVKHNQECIIKEAEFDKEKAESRKEIVEGLLKAFASIDDIIKLIKASSSAAAAREELIKMYKFTEPQAKAIVNMKLGSLANLEKVELENEYAELEQKLKEYAIILSSEGKRLDIIRDRLSTIVKKYGDSRKTEVTQINIEPEEKEIIAIEPEEVVVVLSQTGNIKRVPRKSFRTQRANGKGVKSAEDVILDTISTNTIDTLMLFSNLGKMYRIVVDSVPEYANTARGIHISNLIKLDTGESIVAINSLNRESKPLYTIFFTRKGYIKKTYLEEYTKARRNSGIQAIKLGDDDSIINVCFANKEDAIAVTKQGMSIRFDTSLVNPIGRVAKGVKAIGLNEGDYVIAGFVITDNDKYLATFSEDGLGKKILLSEFPVQGRGGKGLLCFKRDETKKLADVILLNDDNNVLLIGEPNSICINSEDIPLQKRDSLGNIMIKNRVLSAMRL